MSVWSIDDLKKSLEESRERKAREAEAEAEAEVEKERKVRRNGIIAVTGAVLAFMAFSISVVAVCKR